MEPVSTFGLETLSLLIVDDHPVVRTGLRTVLENLWPAGSLQVAEAENGKSALHWARSHPLDLVLLDYRLPDMSGADLLEHMRLFRPQARYLALSNYDDISYIEKMTQAGAQGYILKNIEPFELQLAIRTLLEGRQYFSSEVAIKMLESARQAARGPRVHPAAGQRLTKRELEVLQCIVDENTNSEIARKLCLARRTIDSHRQNLLHKLQVRNTAGLIKAAYKLNLVH